MSTLNGCIGVVVLGTDPCCGMLGVNGGAVRSLFPGEGVDAGVLFKAPLCLNEQINDDKVLKMQSK